MLRPFVTQLTVTFRVLSQERPHLTCATLISPDFGLKDFCLDSCRNPERIGSVPFMGGHH